MTSRVSWSALVLTCGLKWIRTVMCFYRITSIFLVTMGVCAVCGCSSNSRISKAKGIKFFRFPKDSKVQRRWKAACKRKDDFCVLNARVCSLHFKNSEYRDSGKENTLRNSPKKTRRLHPWAAPTLHPPGTTAESGMLPSNIRLA